MQQSGQLSADEYAEINRYYMSGSAESDSVRIFLNKLNRQAEGVYGKLTSRPCNIKRLLNQKGVIAIDGGTNRQRYIAVTGYQSPLVPSIARS